MNLYGRELDRKVKGMQSTGPELDRKYWVALALYGCLAVLVWFTMGEGTIHVYARPVQARLLPLIVIGGLALRTVIARQAEKIRRQGGSGSGSSSL